MKTIERAYHIAFFIERLHHRCVWSGSGTRILVNAVVRQEIIGVLFQYFQRYF